MDFVSIIGIIGAFLVLIAFILEQRHVWKNDDLIYDAVNLLGSSMLIVYGLLIHGYPFVALNGVWAAVSARDVVNKLVKK